MESNGHDRITCAQCPEKLEYNEIQNLASAETFARFDALTTRAALSAIPKFLWCPSPNCASGQVHHGRPEHFPLFTCVACKHSFCTNHPESPDPIPSHPNESCEAYNIRIAMSRRTRERLAQDRESERMLQKLAKRCPGPDCGWWIEKKAGCDHMTCSRCRWEFCWLCKADYVRIRKRGNTEHKKDCRYYGR
ncbi:uncharacterized protein BDZ99DRAFT_422421 [Mytilinidion resinicola]|uniref:RING-type domain-containing protein n=1 Tax=Mytilinidion resinicola TaxID=574789 RepID=A0A6A6YDZ2_9PEZI|nr:uncharacterized protein BDZ99DRAFT_422421 [Mytilinidion resinicola]KAF2807041.1 hypothetical protein BDZ99DRAFT_422421 [Mytilinidion resinicola]